MASKKDTATHGDMIHDTPELAISPNGRAEELTQAIDLRIVQQSHKRPSLSTHLCRTGQEFLQPPLHDSSEDPSVYQLRLLLVLFVGPYFSREIIKGSIESGWLPSTRRAWRQSQRVVLLIPSDFARTSMAHVTPTGYRQDGRPVVLVSSPTWHCDQTRVSRQATVGRLQQPAA